MATTDGQTTRKPTSPSEPLRSPPLPPADPPASEQGAIAEEQDEGQVAAAEGEPAVAAEVPPEVPQGPIYVSYREIKGPPGARAHKKPGHIKKFYLVDHHGNETLAATGEDQGDAHYIYRNAQSFQGHGTLDCHNRRELTAWLDAVKSESQRAANFHLVEDIDPPLPMSPSPVRGMSSPMRLPPHPPFVAYRQEKFVHDDGHRGQKWWLVDEAGHEHLAASAEERDTRDGHYSYKAEGPFAQIHPLTASNMAMVQDWLDQLIVHPTDHSEHLQEGASLATPATHSGRPAKAARSDQSGPSAKRTTKRTRIDTPAEESKRQKQVPMEEGPPLGDKEAVALKLRKLATQEGLRRRAACRSALEWLSLRPPPDQLENMRFWAEALEEALQALAEHPAANGNSQAVEQGDPINGSSTSAMEVDGINGSRDEKRPPSRAAALVDVLEALREVACMHFSLRSLASTGLASRVYMLQRHPEPSIAKLAARIVAQLSVAMGQHLLVLTQPKYLADPLPAAEAALRAATTRFSANEQLVATPQKLASPTSLPAAGVMQPAGTPGSLPAQSAAPLLAAGPPAEIQAPAAMGSPQAAQAVPQAESNLAPKQPAATTTSAAGLPTVE